MACNCKESKRIDRKLKLDLHKANKYSTFRLIIDEIGSGFLRLFTILLGIVVFAIVFPLLILWVIISFIFNKRVMIPLNLDKIGKIVRNE